MILEEKKIKLKDGTIVTLRSPVKEDAKELLAMMAKGAGETDFLLSTANDFLKMSVEHEEQWIEDGLQSDDCTIIGIIDDRIISCCSINFLMGHEKTRHRAAIGITILKDYWNKGLGSALFEELIVMGKAHEGTRQIELGVISDNKRAYHLYEKFGFEKTGIQPRALLLKDGTYLDEVMMTLFLDK